MDEKLLLKICLISAIIMLPITSLFLSLSSKEVHYMTLKGEVQSVKQEGEVTFVKFKTVLPVVFFDRIEINSSKAIISGKLTEYKGKMEFVGEKIDG